MDRIREGGGKASGKVRRQFRFSQEDHALVEQALANTAIDRLQKLEDQVGGFAEKPNGCERFFRSGRTGEGAEQLQPEQRERLATGLAKMMERFNYEGDTSD